MKFLKALIVLLFSVYYLPFALPHLIPFHRETAKHSRPYYCHYKAAEGPIGNLRPFLCYFGLWQGRHCCTVYRLANGVYVEQITVGRLAPACFAAPLTLKGKLPSHTHGGQAA